MTFAELSKSEQEALAWHEVRENHGRGRIPLSNKHLIKLGLLSKEPTSFYCWRIAITNKGREVLAHARTVEA
jgi:hypothetical protein